MSDFQIALLIFIGIVIIGVILAIKWNDTLDTIFTLIGLILQMLWCLFLLAFYCGILILIITFLVHMYRSDL